MRARVKFTTTLNDYSLKGLLVHHNWIVEDSSKQEEIEKKVRMSLDKADIGVFDAAEKAILFHAQEDAFGTIGSENGIFVIRLLNENIHSLQTATQRLVVQLHEGAIRNDARLEFKGPVQIVEVNRKETIIEGQILTSKKERIGYARSHRRIEFWVGVSGTITLLILLFLTSPFSFLPREGDWYIWGKAILEKLIGSVIVTTFISIFQYQVFLRSLREYTIRWTVPGERQALSISSSAT